MRLSRSAVVGPYSRLGIASKCGHLAKKNRLWCKQCTPGPSRFLATRICEVCREPFTRYFYPQHPTHWRQTRCSRKCYSKLVAERQKGEKSHFWQGGKTDANRLLRGSALTANWRRAVFERDGYACIECGHRGKLAADHIKPWSLFPALRFELSNGRALCWPCHRRVGVNPGQMTAAQRAELLEAA